MRKRSKVVKIHSPTCEASIHFWFFHTGGITMDTSILVGQGQAIVTGNTDVTEWYALRTIQEAVDKGAHVTFKTCVNPDANEWSQLDINKKW